MPKYVIWNNKSFARPNCSVAKPWKRFQKRHVIKFPERKQVLHAYDAINKAEKNPVEVDESVD